MMTGVDMIILTGAVLVLTGALLIARTLRRPGRHRAEPEWKHLRPAHARPTTFRRPGNLEPARPHRLVAQDAALSRR
jgi:hypothetical protein